MKNNPLEDIETLKKMSNDELRIYLKLFCGFKDVENLTKENFVDVLEYLKKLRFKKTDKETVEEEVKILKKLWNLNPSDHRFLLAVVSKTHSSNSSI